jgi:hypothetical protein
VIPAGSLSFGGGKRGQKLNLPQFDGHFKKDTIEVEGVSNEKKNTV